MLAKVKDFASTDAFGEYDGYLLQRYLMTKSDMVQCPRTNCDGLAWADSEDLARCQSCTFPFCPKCSRAYHPGNPCTDPNETIEDDPEEDVPDGMCASKNFSFII